MPMRTDDPFADFDRWDDEMQDLLDLLPVCAYCNEPIQDEQCYHIDGDFIHLGCAIDYLDKEYRVDVNNFIE